MDRLNTRDMPRFVLNVEDAVTWLADIILRATAPAPTEARSPMDAELFFDPNWSVSSLVGESQGQRRQMLADMIVAAQEIGILSAPEGIRIEMESGDDGYRFLVTSDDRWGITLAGKDCFFTEAATGSYGAAALMAVLMSAVNEGNAMLRALVEASSLILAQFSTDPVLVTRLADSDDDFVRAVAVDNPVAPDEAKVLRALRESESER